MNKAKQTINNLSQAKKLILVLIAQIVLLAPLCLSFAAFAQTEVPPDGTGGRSDPGAPLSQDARRTDDTVPSPYEDADARTTLIRQAAEQNTTDVIFRVEDDLAGDRFVAKNDVFYGLHKFWEEDIVSNLFHNIGQLIGKWITEFINGWVAETVQFLTGFLRVFVLNPNIAINGIGSSPSDDISPWVRQGADVMYGIAVDLLLLLFILCIWKYWAEAAWRGGGNLMGAVGRLIFTAGLMLAWPTIYAFEIQITNEMIREIFFNSADQVDNLDAAMAAAVKAGLMAGAGLLANATAGVTGQAFGGVLGGGPGGLVLGTVGGVVAWVGLIIYLVLGGILIAELIYILVLKAIQTALLTAQYMFAPIFLVFFATPDTENVTAGFVRSFVEVSLWTFVWVGLLKIMTIIILSDYNPWGKILMAVGVLQLMIQVPSFLARAQISPMSDFISAGLVTGGLLSAGKALGSTLQSRSMQLAEAIGGKFTTGAARGPKQSTNKELNNLPNGVANQQLFNDLKKAGDGKLPTKTQPPLKPIDPKDKDKKNGPGQDGTGKDINGADKKDGKNQPPKQKDPNAADAQGKKLNPLDQNKKGTGSVAEGLRNGLGNAAKGVAVGTAAGTAMAGMGAAANLGKSGQGAGTEKDKAAAAALEQAAMAAKESANLQNAGVVPGATGAESEDEKGKTGVETDVKGKVLNTGNGAKGADGKADGKGKDGKGIDPKTAAAMALGAGLKPPTDKSKLGKGAKQEQAERKLTVNQKEGAAKGLDGKGEGAGITPPSTKDIEGLNKEDKDKLAEGAGVPKVDDQSIDMETEPNAEGVQGGPGIKTTVEAGKMTGSGAGRAQKSVKAALMGAAGAGALMASARGLKGLGSGKGLDATPQKPGGLTAKGKGGAGVGTGVDPVSDAQRELAGPGIVEGSPDLTASAKDLKPPVAGDSKADEVDMAKVQEADQKSASSQAGVAMASALPLMMGAAVKGAMGTPKKGGAQTAKNVKGDLVLGGDNGREIDGPPVAGDRAAQARLNAAQGGNTNTGADRELNSEVNVDKSVSGQVVSGADGKGAVTPPQRDLEVRAQGDGGATGSALKSAAAGAVGAALATSLLRGKGGGATGKSGTAANADLRGAILDAGEDIANETGDAARQAILNTPTSGAKTTTAGDTSGRSDIDVNRSVTGEVVSGGKGQANQPPAMKTEAVVAGGSGNDALKNAAAAGVGAALASHLVRGGSSAGSSGRNLTANEIHGAMVDAGDEIADQTGDAVQQAVLSANNATGKGVDPAGARNVEMDRSVTGEVAGSGQGASAVQPPPMQVRGTADTLKGAAAAGVAAAVTGQLLNGGKGAASINAKGGASNVNIDVDDRDTVEVNAVTGQAVPSMRADALSGQPVQGQVGNVEMANAAGQVASGDGARVDQRVEMEGRAAQAAGQAATETVTGRVVTPPPRVNTSSNRTMDIQGQEAAAGGAGVPPTNTQAVAGGAGGAGGSGGTNGPGGTPPQPPAGGGDDRSHTSAAFEERYNANNNLKPLDMYQQSGYWGIPARSVIGAIRLAQNTTLGPSTRKDGKAELIGNSKGQTYHVRTGEGHNGQQQAMQIMSAGYAGLIGNDPVAYDAARASAIEAKEDAPKGIGERMAAGIFAYNGGSWSQTANAKQRFQLSMYNHAVEGSQAYVGMQPGNEYTQYLHDRYGPMTPEKQAMGAYTTVNAASPESAWNWAHIPATETLVQNSIPISGMSRAVAANLSVQKASPWLRGAAVRGCMSYMNGMASSELPAGTDPMVKDAWVGRSAQMMSPAVVSTCAALAMEIDENAASDVNLVNKVASVVGPGQQNHEYVDAYRGYATANKVTSSFAAPAAPASSGGSGGTVRVPSGGGSAPVTHTISSSGGAAMGGGGYMNEQSYNVEVAPDHIAAQDMDPRITAADINTGTVGGGQHRMRTNVNLTEGLTGAGPAAVPPSRKMRFESPVSRGSMQNDVQIGQYRGASHGGVVETHVEGEIIQSGSGGGHNGVDENMINNDVQKMIAQYGSPEAVANKVVVDMKDAGFNFDQIASENAFKVAMQVSASDPSMMQAAAIATDKLGTENVNMEHVTTVQAVMDADPRNHANNIEASTIYTAQAIGNITEQIKLENPHLSGVSMPPTQSTLTALGQHDDYVPRANASQTGGYKPSVIDFLKQKMEDKLARQNGTYQDPRSSSDSYAR